MAVEDFTTYTEDDDVEGYLSNPIASRCTATNMTCQASCMFYKDYGANNFGNLVHQFKCSIATCQDNSWCSFWSISDNVAEWHYWYDQWVANEKSISFIAYGSGVTARMFRIDDCSNHNSDITSLISLTFDYYITLTRSGTSFVAQIYLDSGRTDLWDTLTITADNSTLRYMRTMVSYHAASCLTTFTGSMEDLCGTSLTAACSEAEAVDGLRGWDGSARIQFERDDDSPLRIWTGSEREGIALVNAGDANASPYAIWTGSARKYWKKFS